MDILTTILCKDLSIDIWQDILFNIFHPRNLFYDGYAYTRLFLYHMQYVNNAHVYSYIQYDIFISRMNLWWICSIAIVYSYVQHDIALPRMSLRNVCHIQHDIFIHTATWIWYYIQNHLCISHTNLSKDQRIACTSNDVWQDILSDLLHLCIPCR